ncbi:MAG: tetraacyldisaccharide 4'-kinase [Gammaproteobacteria bacterium]|jgi:tetraacyldisaccharide 4'-kinase
MKIWYRHSILSYLLLPLSWLFWLIIIIRRWLYQKKIKTICHFPVPIIIVGNITVGGTGKTPFVIWLANLLVQQGFRPGIVSRGYKAQNLREPRLITSTSKVTESGDEPLIIARHTNCPIAIAPNRCKAVKLLIEQYNCDIIISDDGLQHYALARDIEIAIVDGQHKFGNGFLLPAGPLREPISRLKSVSFIIYNTIDMHLRPAVMLAAVNDSKQHLNIKEILDQTIHAVAGIGNPQRFFATLRNLGLQIIEHPFPDHHNFKPKDIDFGQDTLVIMTEKDAVKCAQFSDQRHWFLPVNAELEQDFTNNLLSRISDCVTKKVNT